MLIDRDLCKLCLIYSRSMDLITLGRGSELSKLLRHIAELIDRSSSRTTMFTESYNYVKSLLNSSDPYINKKERLSELGRKIARMVREHIASRNWDLHTAIKISAASNIIDTSVIGYEPRDLSRAIWDEPAIDEYSEIPRDKRIVIALDNAGEAEVDLVLAETLLRNNYNVAIAVRREAYEIDVTYSDVIDRALDLDIEVVATPNTIPPIAYLADGFAVVKGIANLEAYIEMGRIETLHLFRAKCTVLANIFNVPKNASLIVASKTVKNVAKQIFN